MEIISSLFFFPFKPVCSVTGKVLVHLLSWGTCTLALQRLKNLTSWCSRQLSPSVLFHFFKDFIYLFLERGEGREKERERNINVWLPLALP